MVCQWFGHVERKEDASGSNVIRWRRQMESDRGSIQERCGGMVLDRMWKVLVYPVRLHRTRTHAEGKSRDTWKVGVRMVCVLINERSITYNLPLSSWAAAVCASKSGRACFRVPRYMTVLCSTADRQRVNTVCVTVTVATVTLTTTITRSPDIDWATAITTLQYQCQYVYCLYMCRYYLLQHGIQCMKSLTQDHYQLKLSCHNSDNETGDVWDATLSAALILKASTTR